MKINPKSFRHKLEPQPLNARNPEDISSSHDDINGLKDILDQQPQLFLKSLMEANNKNKYCNTTKDSSCIESVVQHYVLVVTQWMNVLRQA